MEAAIEMASDSNASVKYFGETHLSADLQQHIQEVILDDSCSEELPKDGAKVCIKRLTETTNSHRDTFVMRPDRQVVKDTVAFIALNSNKRAKFVHGEEEVPIKAGSLITFSGNQCHRTIVNDGHVKIAGPFHVSSMEYVGNSGESDETCIDQNENQSCSLKGDSNKDSKCCKGLKCVDRDSDEADNCIPS